MSVRREDKMSEAYGTWLKATEKERLLSDRILFEDAYRLGYLHGSADATRIESPTVEESHGYNPSRS